MTVPEVASASAAPAAGGGDPGAYVPTSHPVRNALVVVTLAAIVLVLLWWSGGAHPRLSVPGGGGSYDHATDTGVVTIGVENETPFPIGVEAFRITGPGVEVVSADLGGTSIDASPEIAPGTRASLSVSYRVVGCPTVDPVPWEARAELVTFLGVHVEWDLPLSHGVTRGVLPPDVCAELPAG